MTIQQLTEVVGGRLTPSDKQLDASLLEVSPDSGNKLEVRPNGLYIRSTGEGGGTEFSVENWNVRNVIPIPVEFTTSEGGLYVDNVLGIDPSLPEGTVYNMVTNTYSRVPTAGTIRVQKPVGRYLILYIGSENAMAQPNEGFLAYFYDAMFMTATGSMVQDVWGATTEMLVSVTRTHITVGGIDYPYVTPKVTDTVQISAFSGSDAAPLPVEFECIDFDGELVIPPNLPVGAFDGQIYRIVNNATYKNYELIDGDFITFYNNLTEVIFTRNVNALEDFIKAIIVKPLENKITSLTDITSKLSTDIESKVNLADIRSSYRGRFEDKSRLPKSGTGVIDGDYAFVGTDATINNELYSFSNNTWSPLHIYNWDTDSIPEGSTNKFFTNESYLATARGYYSNFDAEFALALNRLRPKVTDFEEGLLSVYHKNLTTSTELRLDNVEQITITDQPNTSLIFAQMGSYDRGGLQPTAPVVGTGIAVYKTDSMYITSTNRWDATFVLSLNTVTSGKFEVGICDVFSGTIRNTFGFIIDGSTISVQYNGSIYTLPWNRLLLNPTQLRISREGPALYIHADDSLSSWKPASFKLDETGYGVIWNNTCLYTKYYEGSSGFFLNKMEVRVYKQYSEILVQK